MKKLTEKPWGKELLIEYNKSYMVKKLYMHQGHRCSLQFHKKKKETIIVLSGVLNIFFGKFPDNLEKKTLQPHDFFTISSQIIHRMEAVQDCEYLEASTPEQNDVVRLENDYNRNKEH